ncbi:hypothetical protein A6A19_06280 [Actinobacillus delphinicola]|uniref:Uroporphyrin-III C-methyltransferase n=1 Tax=Actinobacillus delphinicola TaxID=51161 RepID=A0A448TU91_9PAST|nr:uroporphyrinogen-III C-methyltransferase [Actinobacillus delphinicola]MDG6897595.1 hypothetical protein [Actinobacillus delphinicola]VEJ09475.1 uroporphyrin-III C-methyltransferase [Actinobacillus delphinicola]
MSKENNSPQDNKADKNVIAPADTAAKAKPQAEKMKKNDENRGVPDQKSKQKTKKGSGTALAILAILLSLGIGAGGYYFIQQNDQQSDSQINQLTTQIAQISQKLQDGSPLSKQLNTVTNTVQDLQKNDETLQDKIANLNDELQIKNQAINALQIQINRLNSGMKDTHPKAWKLAEANYLLNNAYQKLVISDDVPSTIALLHAADRTLAQIDDPSALSVRAAIAQDLRTLMAVKVVDENKIMASLSDLTAEVSDLMPLSLRHEDDNQLSHSVKDWKENIKKSIGSFMDKFIRVTPRNSHSQELLTPRQEIYLRENLRLRLQIATIAVERHQEGVYKQSLQLVADWTKHYFDMKEPVVKQFLATVQKLQDENVAMDLPTTLTSMNLMNKLLDSANPQATNL